MKVTGSTRVFFTIADPIAQVRAPEVFNRIFLDLGLDAVMVPLQVKPGALEATIRAVMQVPNVGGISLSIPHKSVAAGLMDRCSENARIAQAVNAIRVDANGLLEGDLFDGRGFMNLLDRHQFAYVGKQVLVIGAGGAAAAITTMLAGNRVAKIGIYDPDTAKGQALAKLIIDNYGVPSVAVPDNNPQGYDLVVNASPLGLRANDPLPCDVSLLRKDANVVDILMKNQPTPWLQAVKARGLKAQPGFDMLILQTALYLEFFGYPEAAASLRQDDSAVRSLLDPAASCN